MRPWIDHVYLSNAPLFLSLPIWHVFIMKVKEQEQLKIQRDSEVKKKEIEEGYVEVLILFCTMEGMVVG